MDEGRIPLGQTVIIEAPTHPLGIVSLQRVSDIRMTESVVQSMPYGPGARYDSPRLFGGASFGG